MVAQRALRMHRHEATAEHAQRRIHEHDFDAIAAQQTHALSSLHAEARQGLRVATDLLLNISVRQPAVAVVDRNIVRTPSQRFREELRFGRAAIEKAVGHGVPILSRT